MRSPNPSRSARFASGLALLERLLVIFAGWRPKPVSGDHAHTGVEAQHRIVVAARGERFRPFVSGHRFVQVAIGERFGSRVSVTQLSLGETLADDAAVVRLLVFAREAL